MSHTTTRPRRFSRLAAGLTVAAAATATTLLGAAPAYALRTPILVRMSGTTMIITGTTIGDRASTSGNASSVRHRQLARAAVTAGPGCQQFGAAGAVHRR